jgi:hypothetical protein
MTMLGELEADRRMVSTGVTSSGVLAKQSPLSPGKNPSWLQQTCIYIYIYIHIYVHAKSRDPRDCKNDPFHIYIYIYIYSTRFSS